MKRNHIKAKSALNFMSTQNTMTVSEKSDTKPYRLRKRKRERKPKEKQVHISARKKKKSKMKLLESLDMKPLSGRSNSSSAKETNDTISKSLDMNFTVQKKEKDEEPKNALNSSMIMSWE